MNKDKEVNHYMQKFKKDIKTFADSSLIISLKTLLWENVVFGFFKNSKTIFSYICFLLIFYS